MRCNQKFGGNVLGERPAPLMKEAGEAGTDSIWNAGMLPEAGAARRRKRLENLCDPDPDPDMAFF